MKKLIRFFKDPILITLIILWIGSEVILSFFDLMDSNDIFQSLLSSFPVFMLIYGCIIGPILEEVAFRGWIVKNIALRVITYTLLAFFIISGFGLWGILILILFIYPWFFDRNEKRRGITLIVLTSLSFALIHYGNWDSIKTFFILFPCYLSIGLLLGYLAYKTKKLYASTIVHIINNSIAFSAMAFGSSIPGDHFTWNENKMEIQVEKRSIFDQPDQISNVQDRNVITYQYQTIPKIVAELYSTKDGVIAKESPSYAAFYDVRVHSIDTTPIDEIALADLLVDKFKLIVKRKSEEKTLYKISIVDTNKIRSPQPKIPFQKGGSLIVLDKIIAKNFNEYAIFSDSLHNKYWYEVIYLPGASYVPGESKSFDEVIRELEQDKGIRIAPDGTTTVETIYISY